MLPSLSAFSCLSPLVACFVSLRLRGQLQPSLPSSWASQRSHSFFRSIRPWKTTYPGSSGTLPPRSILGIIKSKTLLILSVASNRTHLLLCHCGFAKRLRSYRRCHALFLQGGMNFFVMMVCRSPAVMFIPHGLFIIILGASRFYLCLDPRIHAWSGLLYFSLSFSLRSKCLYAAFSIVRLLFTFLWSMWHPHSLSFQQNCPLVSLSSHLILCR